MTRDGLTFIRSASLIIQLPTWSASPSGLHVPQLLRPSGNLLGFAFGFAVGVLSRPDESVRRASSPGKRTGTEVRDHGRGVEERRIPTAVFGKWHIGDQPDTRPPARGFDESCGLMYSNDMWEFHPESPERFHEVSAAVLGERQS